MMRMIINLLTAPLPQTNDKDFDVLKSIEFPSIKVVTADEFKEV